MRLIDRIGHHYGRLVVERRAPNASAKDTNARWYCRCDCGKSVLAYGQDLAKGKVKSCGCLNAERIERHGMARTRVYNVWKQIFQRCENPNCKSFRNYGARGITVCERWRDFAAFYEDMGDCPPGYTLERSDNNAGYSKENCRWATHRDQRNNTRFNRIVELNGERHTLSTWAEKIGLKQSTLRARIGYGWTPERALTEPVKTKPTPKG